MPLYVVTRQRTLPRRPDRQCVRLMTWPSPSWLVYGQRPLHATGIWREVREYQYRAGDASVWIAPYDAGRVHYRVIRNGEELASGVGPLDDATLGQWVARAARGGES